MPSVPELLYALSTDRLRRLIELREIAADRLARVTSKQALVTLIAAELTRPASVVRAILQCDLREIRLLQLVVSCTPKAIADWEEVLERAGGEQVRQPIERILSSLEELGLAFGTGKGIYISESARYHIPASLSDRYSVSKLLNVYDAQALKRICDNLDLASDTKNHNIEAIESRLLAESTLEAVRKHLDPQEAAVIEALLNAGGAAAPSEVAMVALDGKADEFFRYDWQSRWKLGRDRNAVDRLLSKGLIYVVPDGYGFNLQLVIPSDLLRVMMGNANAAYWTDPPPAVKYLADSPRMTARYEKLPRDIISFLAFLTSQEAPRTNTGLIHKTSLKNAARNFGNLSDYYASFVYACCLTCGLIAPEGPKNAYRITPLGEEWLRLDELSQWQALVNGWRNGVFWAEMFTEPLRKGNEYRDRDTIVKMRNAVLHLATEYSSDQYIDFESLTEALGFRYPLLMSPRALLGESLVSSPVLFIDALFGGSLLSLGLVDLALRRSKVKGQATDDDFVESDRSNDYAVGFKFTDLGAYLLGIPGSSKPKTNPREEHFIVQANCEIFAPPFLAPAVLYRVLAITDPPGKAAAKNTVVLTRDSIRRAVDAGETAQSILAFLTRFSRTAVPQNVEYLIHEVAGKHGHIHIGRGQLYIQTDTPILLDELLARRDIAPVLIRKLTDTVAILGSDEPHKMLRDLRKAGYLPVFDDEARPATQAHVMNEDSAPRRTGDDAGNRAAQLDGTNRNSGNEADIPAAIDTDSGSVSEIQVKAKIDWDRIADDDGKRYEKLAPGGVGSLPGLFEHVTRFQEIHQLLTYASREAGQVEITFDTDNGRSTSIEVVEPKKVDGSFLYAQDSDGELRIYSIVAMRTAMLLR